MAEFLMLAKGAKAAACAQLVFQVLEHPSIHVFGELLDMPNVLEVRQQPGPDTQRVRRPAFPWDAGLPPVRR